MLGIRLDPRRVPPQILHLGVLRSSRRCKEGVMPTAEQCKTYATEYQHLGQEANISTRRATALMGISKSWKILAGQLDRLAAIAKDESK
jgi:hypothetical protein